MYWIHVFIAVKTMNECLKMSNNIIAINII